MSLECDVLVIGAGGAGLRAAIAAHEADPSLRVTLVTKGALGHSGVTATACSDRMAFHATLPSTEPGGVENWRHHADDIYRIGGRVSDADLAATLAKDAEPAFDYLDHLGVPWARRADGSVDQFFTDGSRYARACYTGPYTANHIEEALLRRLRQSDIRVLEHCLVAELLVDEPGRAVVGAALLSEDDGQIMPMSAKAIVLATGGAGQVFAVNVFPPDCTGDGYALAYRAGAELVNLEFIQIGLCSLKTGLACSGSMMRALPRLVNDREEEFLSRYLPSGASAAEMFDLLFSKGASWPVSYNEPSHVIDIAVARELAEGRRVFLDYGVNPADLNLAQLSARVQNWYLTVKQADVTSDERLMDPLGRLRHINAPAVEWLAERGIRLANGDRVEVAPAVQHFQGGVKIRTQAETSLSGLYAAGEVAGGQHGANRPGGNALLDSQVFGRIAGQSAAVYARSVGHAPITEGDCQRSIERLFGAQGLDARQVRARVARGMSAACGVCRTAEGLEQLLGMLDEMLVQGIRFDAAAPAESLEALNILQAARVIAGAIALRDESRGPHLRFASDGALTPMPQSERWEQYLVAHRGAQGPVYERREPVRPPNGE
jgi:succinate dehydrogenase/fumarate reductase flavoprotein subunit